MAAGDAPVRIPRGPSTIAARLPCPWTARVVPPLVVGLLVLLTLLASAPTVRAEPVLTAAPQSLSGAGIADEPRVAVDGKGNAVAVWRWFDGSHWRIQLRRRSPSGGLSSVQTLSASGQDALDPQVAVDGKGNAVAVWTRFDGSHWRIQLRRRSASGTLGPVQILSASGHDADSPKVAVDGKGNAVAVWRWFDGSHWRIQLRRRSPSGGLSSVQTLSASGQDADDPQLAVVGDGSAVVVWRLFDGTVWRVQVRRRSASGSLGVVQTVSTAGTDTEDPQVAVDNVGNAVMVWVGTSDKRLIQLRARSASGRLSGVKTLSSSPWISIHARVAVDRSGNAYVVWEAWGGAGPVIQAVRRSASGNLSSVVWVTDVAWMAEEPDVAVDRTGDAVVIWRGFSMPISRISARAISPSLSLSAVQTLMESADWLDSPHVAVDGVGNAVVAWRRVGASDARVQAGCLLKVQTVSGSGRDADQPRVAVDGKGNAVAVWRWFDGSHWRIQLRRRSTSGSLGAVQTLSASGQDALDPQVAVDGKGNAIAVWTRFDGAHYRIQVRRRSAAGGLSSVRTLSASGRDAGGAQVAVDAGGNALVVWTRFDGAHHRVQVRRRSAAGSLSSVQTLSASGRNADSARLAVDGKGEATVVWRRFDGGNWLVQARRRSAAGSLSALQTLSASGQDASWPEVSIDTSGNAVVAWTRYDGVNDRVQARRRSAAGSLSSVQTLSLSGQPAEYPQLAVAGSGKAIVVWQLFDGASWRVQARGRSASGSLSPVKTLSAAGLGSFDPAVAVDAYGRAVVVWDQSGGGSDVYVQARRRSSSGSLSPVQDVSAACQSDPFQQVAIDRSGDAVVVWVRSDGINPRIQLAELLGGGLRRH